MRTGILVLLMFLLAPPVHAAAHTDGTEGGGRILDGIEAEQADTAALTAETNIFKSIGMGIALSIAQCEELEDCKTIINPGELGQLLGVLDNRINRLVTLQEEGKEDFTEVLTAYVDQRESYLRYKDQLEQIVGPEEAAADATFGVEGAGEQIDLSVFQDADETLEDLEEDLGEALPADENPAEEVSVEGDAPAEAEPAPAQNAAADAEPAPPADAAVNAESAVPVVEDAPAEAAPAEAVNGE